MQISKCTLSTLFTSEGKQEIKKLKPTFSFNYVFFFLSTLLEKTFLYDIVINVLCKNYSRGKDTHTEKQPKMVKFFRWLSSKVLNVIQFRSNLNIMYILFLFFIQLFSSSLLRSIKDFSIFGTFMLLKNWDLKIECFFSKFQVTSCSLNVVPAATRAVDLPCTSKLLSFEAFVLKIIFCIEI